MCTKPEGPTWTAKAYFRKDNLPEDEAYVFNVIAANCEHGDIIFRLPNNNVWVEIEKEKS